jgi:glycosyltransferase involved in cell wall biosynthesis
MLYRVFSGFNPGEYYLVSRQFYEKKTGEAFLPVQYFYLPTPRFLYWLNKLKMPHQLRELANALLPALSRAYKLICIVRKNPVDAIIACTGDIADIPAGYLASRILGLDFYAYLFDDYVYQWVGFQRSIAKFLASLIFRKTAGVIGPNEYVCEEYKQRYESRYVVVRNPGDPSELAVQPCSDWPSVPGRIKIMYTGAIYHANYDCFRRLIQSIDLIDAFDVELHIYTAQTVEQLSSQGIDGKKVYIHSHVPYENILEEQRKADILFLPLAFESPIQEVLRNSAPGKMAEYLASGRPILAHVPSDSFVAYYMRQHQCAMVADENNPERLMGSILSLINNESLRHLLIQNARRQAQTDFDPQTSRQQLNDFLASPLNRN